MKNPLFFVILLTAMSNSAFSQVDYSELKSRYEISCGIPDSAQIVETFNFLDSLKSFEISVGEKEFLYDYGWVHYMKYLKWKNLGDLKIAATSFEKSWKEFQDIAALWNLGGIYRVLGECDKAIETTELYIEKMPDKSLIDYKQVYYRYKFCWLNSRNVDSQ